MYIYILYQWIDHSPTTSPMNHPQKSSTSSPVASPVEPLSSMGPIPLVPEFSTGLSRLTPTDNFWTRPW